MAEINFGTDGWRAIIAEEFTFDNVERVAYAVGKYVQENYYKNSSAKPPLLISHDTRFLADKFAYRAAQVLIGMGVPVKLTSHDCPTPTIAWATQHEATAGALQFTASHNPPEYCGIKYIPEYAGPATNEITDRLLSHLQDLPEGYEAPKVEVPYFDPKPPYTEALKKLIDCKRIGESGLRVGFDALYSTSRGYINTFLEDAGLKEVHTLHDWRDPLFGGCMPEPKQEYLVQLAQLVKDKHLDVGLATDGDADRLAVIDELGGYFRPNQLLCLFARHLIKNRGETGSIIRTVATTHILDRLAEIYGLEVIETPVGFKYIGEYMRKGNVLLGGEESGGFSFKGHIPEKDGIVANLLLVEMMAYEKKPLSQIWADFQQEIGLSLSYRRADLQLTRRTQKLVMDQLLAKPPATLAGEKVTKVSKKDGLKLYIDHYNWFLIRPSGTEPLLRLYAEGTPAERLDRFMSDFHAQIDAILKTIDTRSANGSTVGAGLAG
jgi:phosphomannomutase